MAGGGKGEGEVENALLEVEDKVPSPSLSSSSSSPAEDNHLKNQTNAFLKLVKVDVVAENLLYFLESLEDMKALSQASTETLEIVRRSKWFLTRTRLRVTKGLNGLCRLPWRHLFVNVAEVGPEVLEEVDNINGLLGAATSLFLHGADVTGKVGSNISEHLERILNKTKCMTTLRMEEMMLYKIDKRWWGIEGVKEVLQRLQSIDICHFKGERESHDYDRDMDHPFWDNLSKLSLFPSHLRSFIIRVPDPYLWFSFQPKHLKFIRKNANTLEKLELDTLVENNFYRKLKKVGVPKCPNLKSFKLSLWTNLRGGTNLSDVPELFLKNQLPLEELEISICNNSIMSSMQQGLGCNKLKKLHLELRPSDEGQDGLLPCRPRPCIQVDWSFLRGMHLLNDISISLPSHYTRVPYGEDIIRALPPQLEKVSLSGFLQDFWRGYSRRGPNPNFNVGSLLAPLKNLKEINLFGNCGAVTDDGLQTIITNWPNLRSLGFSAHDGELTDFGITGVRRTRPGPWSTQKKTGRSLSDLTELTSLTVASCPNVSIQRLFSAVNFRFLRAFKYRASDGARLDPDLVFLLASSRNNPSLEKLELIIPDPPEFDDTLSNKLLEINPRLINFNIREPYLGFLYSPDLDPPDLDDEEGAAEA